MTFLFFFFFFVVFYFLGACPTPPPPTGHAPDASIFNRFCGILDDGCVTFGRSLESALCPLAEECFPCQHKTFDANDVVYRPGYFTVHPPPPPAPSGPKFSNSENCCGSENAMPPKIFWDMEGHRGHFRSKYVFFFKKHILKKIHNKSHYFLKF